MMMVILTRGDYGDDGDFDEMLMMILTR